jgi:hypothetical protein
MSNGGKEASSLAKILGSITAGIGAIIVGVLTAQHAPWWVSKLDKSDTKLSPTPTPSISPISPSPSFPPTSVPTPSPTFTPTPLPERSSGISGQWVGKYTCSQGITGVTVTIEESKGRAKAVFSLYPLPENPSVPRGISRYDKGVFDSNSRRIGFPEGEWELGSKPGDNWKAFGFRGRFDEDLQAFSGEIDGYRCTNIELTRKGS